MKKVLLFFAIMMMAIPASAWDMVFNAQDTWTTDNNTKSISCTKDGVTLTLAGSQFQVSKIDTYYFDFGPMGTATITVNAGTATVTGITVANSDKQNLDLTGAGPWTCPIEMGGLKNGSSMPVTQPNSFTVHIQDAHNHNYADAWSKDETNHWHACTGEGECDAPKADEAAHSYGEVATETAYYTCSVCQYENATRKAEYEAAVKAAADQAAADAVVTKINAIGTVEYTEASKALIDAAREAYDALTDDQKALITTEQLKVLTDAEAEYANLKAVAEKAAADQAAADAVVTKINAIGTVAYTEASKALIDAAREAYDALTADQKALVTAEQLKVLTDAEATYADLEAADAVVTKIDAIGTVEYTDASKALIDAARAAYDALTADQKALVTAEQLKVLTDAEAEYARLKAIDDVEITIAAIGEVEYTEEGKDECWAKIEAAREAYDALPNDDDKAEVENYQTLQDAEEAWNQLLGLLWKSTLAITDAKYGTFVAPYAVNLPEGVIAYTVSGVKSNKVTLVMEEVTGKLPANTPVVIYSDEPVKKEYELPIVQGIPQKGILVGVLVDTDIRSGYVMQNQNGLVGFYQVNGIKTVPANHAYIAQSASTDGVDDERVKAYFFDSATAIKALGDLTNGKTEIYDLNGRKQTRLQKGINIVNGVKVLVK